MSDVITVIEQVATDPHFRSDFTVIFDLLNARYTAQVSDGDALVSVLKQKRNHFKNKSAAVVPESLHNLAKLYCLLANVAGFGKIRCFTDLREAQQWCKLTE